MTSSASTTAKGAFPTSFPGNRHGVAEPEGFFLACIGDRDQVGDFAHQLEFAVFAAGFESVFEFETDVEVVFDGRLAPAGHDDNVLDAGR